MELLENEDQHMHKLNWTMLSASVVPSITVCW